MDSDGNEYFEGNVYNDILNSVNVIVADKTNMELGITIWGKNSDALYILTKKGDKLGNIFEVNLLDKSIKDLSSGINCLYDNLYIDPSKGYVVYSTYPYTSPDKNAEKFKDDVYLNLKYFNSDEIIEVAHVKGENIKFGIYNNVLDYIYRENNEYVDGNYTISESVPPSNQTIPLTDEKIDENPEYVKIYTDFLLNTDIKSDFPLPIMGYYLFDLNFDNILELGVLHHSGGSMKGYFEYYCFDGN